MRQRQRMRKHARENRKRLRSDAEDGEWSGKKKRKIFRRLDDDALEELHRWMKGHPDVVESPCSNDTILVKGVDGKKTPVAKLLLQCSYVKLHNDMIKSPEEGGFAGARDKSGKVIISDTALRLNRPKNLKPMTNRHKQMCGCETCIVSKQLLLTLNEWRRRHVQRLENESRQRHDRYKQQLFFCQHKDVKSEMMSVMCEPCDGQTLPRWKCVIRSCKDCPEYAIPDEEKT